MSAEDKVLADIDNNIEDFEEGEPKEVTLDGSSIKKFTPKIAEKLKSIAGLQSLNLNECDLESFESFPDLPSLERLQIFNNSFKGAELKNLIPHVPNVQSLLLGENDIQSLEDIRCFADLKSLAEIEISGSAYSETANYRNEVFGLIPSLEILDNLDKEGNDVGEDDEGIPLGKLRGMIRQNDAGDDDEEEEYEEEEDDDDEEDKGARKKVKV